MHFVECFFRFSVHREVRTDMLFPQIFSVDLYSSTTLLSIKIEKRFLQIWCVFPPADNAISCAELKRINQGSRARFTTTCIKAATKSFS